MYWFSILNTKMLDNYKLKNITNSAKSFQLFCLPKDKEYRKASYWENYLFLQNKKKKTKTH